MILTAGKLLPIPGITRWGDFLETLPGEKKEARPPIAVEAKGSSQRQEEPHMYSTTNDAAAYSMVPRAMLGTLKPAPFRQWVQLERHSGKRDYVDLSAVDLGQVWNGMSRQKALKASYALAEWVVMEETGTRGVTRYWPSPARLTTDEKVDQWLAVMRDTVEKRADGAKWKDGRARSFREVMMTRKGTACPYVHVPLAVLEQADTDGDFLAWVAMRSFLGPEGISAAAGTIGERAGMTREAVTRSAKRLVESGLLLPTGETGWKGTRGGARGRFDAPPGVRRSAYTRERHHVKALARYPATGYLW
ncbi:hypothetical protein [Streptomyces sp. NPDC001508]|uniref:hypothetical protein n=1 Tax=Streptomyces sp. NPDC001508 TaxID=3154656 RepID=UPI0033251E9A